jgi:IclR family transcriptional regulator, pca regulon regulatory protein
VGEEQDPNIMGGLVKGLRVIETFQTDRQKLAIAEVARLTGYDRASCRRLLLTLVHMGYAEHDGKYFRLTPLVLRLGFAYLHAAPLPNMVQPFLDQLSRDTEESCSASILERDHIVYIARAAKHRVMSINLSIGSRLPAYCSSMGRVLLAALDPDAARRVLTATERPARTSRTLTDVTAISAELEQVRRQGYAIIDEELELGLRSVAVPVMNSRDDVVAAINIGAQAARVSVQRIRDEFVPKLRDVQADLKRLIQADRM